MLLSIINENIIIKTKTAIHIIKLLWYKNIVEATMTYKTQTYYLKFLEYFPCFNIFCVFQHTVECKQAWKSFSELWCRKKTFITNQNFSHMLKIDRFRTKPDAGHIFSGNFFLENFNIWCTNHSYRRSTLETTYFITLLGKWLQKNTFYRWSKKICSIKKSQVQAGHIHCVQ